MSVYRAAVIEAMRHKWIESQKCGYDLGEAAIWEWFDLHWLDFCRHRNVEHVSGLNYWQEFLPERFGRIEKLLVEGDLLLELIIDRVLQGWENLTFMCWAHEWGLPKDRIINILSQLDINSARLTPQYYLVEAC